MKNATPPDLHRCGARLCSYCGQCHYHGCGSSKPYCKEAAAAYRRMLQEQERQQNARNCVQRIHNALESIQVELEASKNPWLRYPEYIEHNINNYGRDIQEDLVWLNANGFPATLHDGQLSVQGLEEDTSKD